MSILESFKVILKTNKLTWFGKIFALLLDLIMTIIMSVVFIAIYPIYILVMFIYFLFCGKFHITNLWEITDWSLIQEEKVFKEDEN